MPYPPEERLTTRSDEYVPTKEDLDWLKTLRAQWNKYI